MRFAQSMFRHRSLQLLMGGSNGGRSTRAISSTVSTTAFNPLTVTKANNHHFFASLKPTSAATTTFRRAFSSESSAQTELLDILAREEQEEIDSGNLELPEELAKLKKTLEKEWRIVDNADNAMTQMFLKNKKVQVSFHCQDTIESDDDLFGDESGAVNGEDEEEEPAPAVRFTVTISKAGKIMVVNCLSEFGEGKIEGITITSGSSPDSIHASQGVVDKSEYQGPDFLELAEDLQESFGVYFEEECGITPDVAAFVAMYADYKEQSQYVKFLKDAQSIIS